MDGTIVIAAPVPPEVMATFLGILVVYLVYAAVKVVVSLWTGA